MRLKFLEFRKFILPSILGLIDVALDVIYYLRQDFYNESIQTACLVFLLTLILLCFFFFFFLHLREETSYKLPWIKICERSIKLAFLFEIKVAHFFETLWVVEEDPDFEFNETLKSEIVAYQDFSHGALQALPQLIIQLINNFYMQSWTNTTVLSLIFSSYFTGKLLYRIARNRHSNGFELRDSVYINRVEIDT
jgi:hypothetical protein